MKTVPYIILAALCGALFFWCLGSTPIFGLDEGFYSECSREMLASGDYLVPRVNGEYFFDKPPLVYWMQAASMRVFGVNPLAVRIPSALCLLALVGWTVYCGRLLFCGRAGIFAGFALASTILPAALARMGIMDGPLALAIAISLGSFILCYMGKWPRTGYLIMWAAMGASALIKGPVGVALVPIIVLVFLVQRRQIGEIRRMMPIAGFAIFAAITIPWYAMVNCATDGAFMREFVFHQVLQRAAGQDFGHNQPFWLYIPILLLGFFPWSVFLPISIRSKDKSSNEAAIFATIWACVVFVIFSAIKSKLMGYIFPMFMPCALLVGSMWAQADSGRLRKSAIVAAVVSVILSAGLQVARTRLPDDIPGLAPVLMAMSVSMALGAIIGPILIYMNRKDAAFAWMCAGMAGFVMIAAAIGLPTATKSQAQPTVDAARYISKENPRQVLSFGIPSEQAAIAFYLRRPIRNLTDAAQLKSAIKSSDRSVLIIGEKHLQSLPPSVQPLAKFGRLHVYNLD